MNILVLWAETPIGQEICKLPNTLWIATEFFSTRWAKLDEPVDVIINCCSLDEKTDMNNIYGVNVIGNQRMMATAEKFGAHYIWISTHRIWNGGECFEDTPTTWDATDYGNTMCLSEYHMKYPRTTIVRVIDRIDSEIIRKIIAHKIYGKVNVPSEKIENGKKRSLYTRNPMFVW